MTSRSAESPPRPSAGDGVSVPVAREALVRWFERHRRDLPWRRTRDPYAIWISEVMLQQTRVETVIPYYERFLARFPEPAALAEADPERVRAAWSGLGYYRRAAQLHEAARRVVSEHGGRLPRDAVALAALPGFGPYTVGAVGSFAFDLPLPALDGNVKRVLARIHAIDGPLDRQPHRRQLESVAQSWVAADRPGRTNEALMELGATVCAPRGPACPRCPVRDACRARALDAVDRIPPPKSRPSPRRQDWTAVCWWSGDHVWLAPRPAGIFAGLWCLPMAEGATPPAPPGGLEAASTPEDRGTVEHRLTHRRLVVRVWSAAVPSIGPPAPGAPVEAVGAAARAPPPGRWVRLADLADHGVPSFTAKLLRAALPPEKAARMRWRGRRTGRRAQPGLPGLGGH